MVDFGVCVAVCCGALQCVVVCCDALCAAVSTCLVCRSARDPSWRGRLLSVCYNVLQCVAVRCSALQCLPVLCVAVLVI